MGGIIIAEIKMIRSDVYFNYSLGPTTGKATNEKRSRRLFCTSESEKLQCVGFLRMLYISRHVLCRFTCSTNSDKTGFITQ